MRFSAAMRATQSPISSKRSRPRSTAPNKNGNFVVTPELIIPNLAVLQEYKPLLRQLFSHGLFGPMDERYFRLIDRSADMADEVEWSALDIGAVFGRFQAHLQFGTQRP